jgi:hypothetical protein
MFQKISFFKLRNSFYAGFTVRIFYVKFFYSKYESLSTLTTGPINYEFHSTDLTSKYKKYKQKDWKTIALIRSPVCCTVFRLPSILLFTFTSISLLPLYKKNFRFFKGTYLFVLEQAAFNFLQKILKEVRKYGMTR